MIITFPECTVAKMKVESNTDKIDLCSFKLQVTFYHPIQIRLGFFFCFQYIILHKYRLSFQKPDSFHIGGQFENVMVNVTNTDYNGKYQSSLAENLERYHKICHLLQS